MEDNISHVIMTILRAFMFAGAITLAILLITVIKRGDAYANKDIKTKTSITQKLYDYENNYETSELEIDATNNKAEHIYITGEEVVTSIMNTPMVEDDIKVSIISTGRPAWAVYDGSNKDYVKELKQYDTTNYGALLTNIDLGGKYHVVYKYNTNGKLVGIDFKEK